MVTSICGRSADDATRSTASATTASISTTDRSVSGSAALQPGQRDQLVDQRAQPGRLADQLARRSAAPSPGRRRRPAPPRPAARWRRPGSSARARRWPRSPGGPPPPAAPPTRPRPPPATRPSPSDASHRMHGAGPDPSGRRRARAAELHVDRFVGHRGPGRRLGDPRVGQTGPHHAERRGGGVGQHHVAVVVEHRVRGARGAQHLGGEGRADTGVGHLVRAGSA